MKVSLVYRSQNLKGHSIENVFDSVSACIGNSDEIDIEKEYLPCTGYSIKGFIKNLMYLRKVKADVYHITGDVHYAALALSGKKTVLTVHDLRMLTKYTGLKKIIYSLLWVKIPVLKCAAVTAISESTKKEIMKICRNMDHKIVVVPDPISEKFRFAPKEFNAECPKILMIGTKENKNHIRMIEAVRDIPCELIVIGVLPKEERKKLDECNIKYRNYVNLSEKDLIQKYKEADIIMFVSTYEGFGMPIIEGQTLGRVVVTSDISPMKDICGDGAMVVDPLSISCIRDGVKEIIENEQLRNELIEKGRINARHYTAFEVAKEYKNIYKRISRACLD